MTLREPFARREETWHRALNSPTALPPEEDSIMRHPEMIELLLAQQREMGTLHVTHSMERVRLGLTLKRELNNAASAATTQEKES